MWSSPKKKKDTSLRVLKIPTINWNVGKNSHSNPANPIDVPLPLCWTNKNKNNNYLNQITNSHSNLMHTVLGFCFQWNDSKRLREQESFIHPHFHSFIICIPFIKMKEEKNKTTLKNSFILPFLKKYLHTVTSTLSIYGFCYKCFFSLSVRPSVRPSVCVLFAQFWPDSFIYV